MSKAKPETGAEKPTLGAPHAPLGSDNTVELRIPARAEWVRVVRLATAGVAARLGFSYDEIEDLKLAVAEACNNAILHGQKSSPDSESTPEVTVRWAVFPDRLRVSVTDQGRMGEDGLPLRSPEDLEGEELPEGGMGLILIQSLMDEVEHESGPHADTTLHMTKYAPVVSTRGTRVERRALPARSTPAANDGDLRSNKPRHRDSEPVEASPSH